MLGLYGIKTLAIHGKVNQSTRTEIIKTFRTSGVDGPRVLLLSSVGETGLNLPCANIMVVTVSSSHFPGTHVDIFSGKPVGHRQ